MKTKGLKMSPGSNKSSNKEIVEEIAPGYQLKARHVLMVMIFFVTFNTYALRVNLSVAIVAMVNTTEKIQNGTSSCTAIHTSNNYSSPAVVKGVFDWDTTQQGVLLGSFYYGYFLSNIFGPWLSKKIGFKIVIGAALLLANVTTLLIPVAAHASFGLVVAMRAFIGFVQGGVSPSVVGLWEAWGPILERSFLTSFGLCGGSVGSFVTLSLGGVIVEKLGWKAMFYITGGTGLGVVVSWFIFVYDTPEQHPRISEQEKIFITSCRIKNTRQHVTSTPAHEHEPSPNQKLRVPWISIVTSMPVLAIFSSHFAIGWTVFMMLTMLPTYMTSILGFDITKSGLLSALPHVLHGFFVFSGGYVTDLVRRKKILPTIVIRKIDITLALAIPALFLLLAGYIGCNAAAATAFLTLSVAFCAFEIPGGVANTLDVAPKYAGIVYGIANTISSISGFLGPLILGRLLADGNTISRWQIIFWISAGICLAGNVMFLIFGSDKEQLWAQSKPKIKLDTAPTETPTVLTVSMQTVVTES